MCCEGRRSLQWVSLCTIGAIYRLGSVVRQLNLDSGFTSAGMTVNLFWVQASGNPIERSCNSYEK